MQTVQRVKITVVSSSLEVSSEFSKKQLEYVNYFIVGGFIVDFFWCGDHKYFVTHGTC